MAKNQKNNHSRSRSKSTRIKRHKILITGSEGFIGSAITRELIKKNFEIYGIGRKRRDVKKYKYFKIDLTKKKVLENFFNKNNFDSVIHTAWITNPLTMRNSELNKNWLQVSKNILNCHLKNKGKKFYCIGTSDEYYRQKNKKNKCIENKSKIINLNSYAKNKILFYRYLKKSKISHVWFRVFWLFGNKENRKRFFPQVISRLSKNKNTEIKNPEIGLDYTNVDDAAKMIVKVISKKNSNGIYNICSGDYKNLGKIAQFIAKILNKKKYLKFRESKIKTKIYGCIKKLKKNKFYTKSNFHLKLRKFVLSYSKITS